MLAEFFQELVAHAQKGLHPRVVKIQGDPDFVTRLAMEDGDLMRIEADVQPLNHRHHCLESFLSQARDGAVAQVAQVWFSTKGIVLIFDKAARRDRATFPLQLSPQMHCLGALAKASEHKLTQAKLLRLLRVDMAGCVVGGNADLLSKVEVIRWRKVEDGEVVNKRNVASVGKSLESKLMNNETPASVVFTLPVFSNPGLRHITAQVCCDLEILPDDQAFILSPLPGELEAAEFKATEALAHTLGTELQNVELYHGEP